MRLCLQFGCTLSEIRERLTVQELNQWYAFTELEQWGDARADARIAVMGSAVCGSMGAKVKPAQLIPTWGEPDNNKFNGDMFRVWAEAHNRRISGSE